MHSLSADSVWRPVGSVATQPSAEAVCRSARRTAALVGYKPRECPALSFDAASGRYNYVWKTDKPWANTCRQLILNFNDGSVQRANFKFTQ